MDSTKLQSLMMAEGLKPITDSTSWDWNTGRVGFGHGVQLCNRSYWASSEEMHHISFDDIKVFEKMTEEQVLAEISKVRQELLMKIHLHGYFKRFCTMSPQEQAACCKSFFEWDNKERAEGKKN